MKDKNDIHKTLGFSTPEDYFKQLEDQLISHCELEQTMPKDDAFKVPEYYFNQLTDKLMASTTHDSSKKSKLSFLNTWYYVAAVAASVIIVLSVYTWTVPAGDTSLELAQLETSEIENYLTYSSSLTSDVTLVDLYEQDTESLEEIPVEHTVSDQELLDFLDQELELNDILIE